MNYDTNNIFAKMLRGEIPCDKVYEDDYVLAFNDISPQAPVHVLFIPKGEYISFDDFSAKGSPEEITNFYQAVQKVAKQLDLQEGGYRIITNMGKSARQEVMHYHLHLLAGCDLGTILKSGLV